MYNNNEICVKHELKLEYKLELGAVYEKHVLHGSLDTRSGKWQQWLQAVEST